MRAMGERERLLRPARSASTRVRALAPASTGGRVDRVPSPPATGAWSFAEVPLFGGGGADERDAERAAVRLRDDPFATSGLPQANGPLPAPVRAHFEARIGHDFGAVRVHTDERAAAQVDAIGARAFTVGNEIAFGPGQYRPDHPDGRALLAHELTHVAQGAAGPTTLRAAPKKWSKTEIAGIQKQLVRLGLLHKPSGALDADTRSALVEAYGDESWSGLTAVSVLTSLTAAKAPSGKKGEHRLRWGEMFKDGVLDMTLGLGFDEGGSNKAARDSFVKDLTGKGFSEKKASDKELRAVYAAAGRAMAVDSVSRYFLKKDALTYKPPVGAGRKIHAVVRLVYSLDGSKGKEVADAFKSGMVQSDIAYYSGHGRYGSGPDFDRNFTFKLYTIAKGKKTLDRVITGYDELHKLLKKEGAAHKRSAWGQFEHRIADGTLEVEGSNAGNIFLNDKDPHAGEFGSKLMYWNLKRKGGKGAPLQTGVGGPLAKAADKHPERHYRVIVFDGCRSEDYNKALRATPHFDTRSMDELGSSHELMWGDEGGTLAAFLDGILKMQSAEEIARRLDDQQKSLSKADHPAYHAYGIKDNPVNK